MIEPGYFVMGGGALLMALGMAGGTYSKHAPSAMGKAIGEFVGWAGLLIGGGLSF